MVSMGVLYSLQCQLITMSYEAGFVIVEDGFGGEIMTFQELCQIITKPINMLVNIAEISMGAERLAGVKRQIFVVSVNPAPHPTRAWRPDRSGL